MICTKLHSCRTIFPVKTLATVIGIWLILAALNFFSLKYFRFTGADPFFPFSVLYPSAFLWMGIMFALLFLISGLYMFFNLQRFSYAAVIAACITLVILGNMSQGNLDIAFEQPFYLKGRQYYSDAVNITNGQVWLRQFTDQQLTFQLHTITHPPFITLLHYEVLKIVNGSVLGLGIVFFLLSGLYFVIFRQILFYFKVPHVRAKQLLLLSAVIPSVNIYLLVSIDGLVLASSSLLLWGIGRMLYKSRMDLLSFTLCFLSILITNMITYSGLFLVAFFGLYAVIQIYLYRRYEFFLSLILSVGLCIIFFVAINYLYGYNQLKAFIVASASENPNGFMLLHNPYVYFWTRLQGVGEILMFLSLGFVAVLLGGKKFQAELFRYRSVNLVFVSALVAVGCMFLSGAYGTGETARACLFIVPYFLLLLGHLNKRTFTVIFLLSLFQTFGMQLIGNYYW